MWRHAEHGTEHAQEMIRTERRFARRGVEVDCLVGMCVKPQRSRDGALAIACGECQRGAWSSFVYGEETPREFFYGFFDLEKSGIRAAMISSSGAMPGPSGGIADFIEREMHGKASAGKRLCATMAPPVCRRHRPKGGGVSSSCPAPSWRRRRFR